MCVILACETSRPSLDTLLKCEGDNPHGGGIAWRHNGVVQFKKGLDAKEINSIAMKAELPFVIHFRIATAGGYSPAMCHPFPIGGSVKMRGQAPSVLFHNGHWGDWEDVFLNALVAGRDRRLPEGDISDTRAIAIMVGWYGKNFLKLVKNQKFVYFGASALEIHGYWTKVDGIHFSNMYWNASYGRYSSKWDGEQWTNGYTRTPATTAPPQLPQSTTPSTAKQAAEVFISGTDTTRRSAADHLGVTEAEIDELERKYGLVPTADGHLVSTATGEAIEAELVEEDGRVVVGTFGDGQPIKVANS
jgi:hypothetical protein